MWFFVLGLSIGAFGTLIGAGGGFILVPVLLMFFPVESLAVVTGVSLFCVALNALSGSVAYIMQKRVHWPSVVVFALASLPGAWWGATLVDFIPRRIFEIVFAVLLFALGMRIFLAKKTVPPAEAFSPDRRTLIKGGTASFGIGFVASLMGIGGGILHVPILTQWLRYPVHLAVGVSQVVLALTASLAAYHHYYYGNLDLSLSFLPWLAVGIIVGAQAGAQISKRVSGTTILRILAVAVCLLGLRLVLR